MDKKFKGSFKDWLIVVLFSFSAFSFWKLSSNKIGAEESNRKSATDQSIYEKINLFNEVMKKVSDNYVYEVSDEELIMRAIKWMVNSLDPFSAYMSPAELKDMEVETRGQFGGLGIEITKKDYYILVITPIEDTPAWRAGILPGDRIIKIDGEPTRDMTVQDAVRRLRGQKGTKVVITIERSGWDEPKDIELIRDIIKVKSVRASTIEKDILYVRLTNFQERTSDDLLDTLKKSGLYEGKIKGVILDLRSNPGGLLSEAIKVGDLFVGDEVIVSTRGRNSSKDYRGRKERNDFPAGVSLVVLVNRGSASASEIVAGAIKDNKKGIIVGQRTFGKASVQTIIPISNGGALRLTTAHYYTPLGTNIEEKGIQPDILFKPKGEERSFTEMTPQEILERRQHPEYDEEVKFAISIIRGEPLKVKQNQKEPISEESED
ncbi:MAG: S41 family peptidase [bacterium]|nr:S41 family peptidase [bacterium]